MKTHEVKNRPLPRHWRRLFGVAIFGTIFGAIFGALFIEFVPNLADKVSKAAPGAVYGVILIAAMFLMPQGAGGAIYQLWRKVVARKS